MIVTVWVVVVLPAVSVAVVRTVACARKPFASDRDRRSLSALVSCKASVVRAAGSVACAGAIRNPIGLSEKAIDPVALTVQRSLQAGRMRTSPRVETGCGVSALTESLGGVVSSALKMTNTDPESARPFASATPAPTKTSGRPSPFTSHSAGRTSC